MALYRGPKGTVEAVQFVSRDVNSELVIRAPGTDADAGDTLPVWVIDALNSKQIDLSAIGRGLVITYNGGSYGAAPSDWLLLDEDSNITPRTNAQFAAQYERVDG